MPLPAIDIEAIMPMESVAGSNIIIQACNSALPPKNTYVERES